jgi:DNA-binding transcriptional LysR family regulator
VPQLQDLNLQYLYEAARLGSMRAAADLLTVAASSISRQIAQLEAELGTALIEHGSRRIKLTEAGRLLIEYHESQLAQREIFEERLADLKGLRTGRVSLAMGEGFVGTPLCTLLNRFVNRHSGLQVDVRILASSSEVARLVVEDEAHLGLAFHTHDDPRIRVVSSMSQPLCAVMPPSHELAGRPALSLCDLIRFPMCLPETSFRTRQILKELEIAERVTLQPSVSCNSIALLKSLLLCGDLCTLLPLLAVAEEVERGELIAIPLTGIALQGTYVHLINRLGRRLTPAPLSLMNELSSYLNRYAPRPGVIKSRPTLVADNVRQL